MSDSDLHYIDAGELEVGYFDRGLPGAPVAILLHGFPYDTHAYDEVSTALTAVGCRVIVPYLRGYGPTAFKDPATLRSGQQGALAHDLLSLMDALDLRHAVLAGAVGMILIDDGRCTGEGEYDWEDTSQLCVVGSVRGNGDGFAREDHPEGWENIKIPTYLILEKSGGDLLKLVQVSNGEGGFM